MKNEFTYNVFFKKDGLTFQETMNQVLLSYVKQFINEQNFNDEYILI